MRVYLSVLKATSTINQARLIEKILREHGFEVEYRSFIRINDFEKDDVAGAIYFTLASLPFLLEHVATITYAKKPVVVYLTIEGIPIVPAHMRSMISRINVVAVSNFVAECLSRAGFSVGSIIHHAIDKDVVATAMKYVEVKRRMIEKRYKDRVVFLYVGRNDPRKALNKLAQAVKILEQIRDDFVLLLKTEPSAKSMFDGVKHVEFIDTFGSSNYVDNMALIGACDYLVFPSVCEGFGLPVLEANAMGVPAIHCWFPPLSEFSSKEFNFVFNYDDVQIVRSKGGQYWIFHDYAPEWLADTMNFAIEIYRNDHTEYQEYCAMAREHALKFDYRVKYKRFAEVFVR